jgi:hypothetical protein
MVGTLRSGSSPVSKINESHEAAAILDENRRKHSPRK